MTHYLSPGTEFRENPPAIVTFRQAPTNIGAFVGIAERGPVGEAVYIDSMEKFRRVFGNPVSGSYLYHAVQGFFDEAAGAAACWVVRTAHYTDINDPTTSDAVGASSILANSTPTTSVTLTARPGAFGNRYRVTCTREDVIVGLTGAALTIAVAATSLQLAAGVGRRVNVGDTLKFGTGGTVERAIVTAKNGDIIYFASITPAATIALGSNVTVETFSINLIDSGRIIASWTNLRLSPLAGANYVENAIDFDGAESILDAVVNAITPSPTVDPRPAAVASPGQAFTSGSDGSAVVDADLVGTFAGRTGLYALPVNDINMVAIPGEASATVHVGLQSFLTRYPLIIAFVSPPLGTVTAANVRTYFTSTANIANDGFFALAPWVKMQDPVTGLPMLAPPEGHAMGLAALVVRRRNIAKAFAGTVDGRFTSILGLEVVFQEGDRDLLYPSNINTISSEPEGFCIWGSRTMGVVGSSDLGQIAKRRVRNFAMKTVLQNTRWVLFDENTVESRARWKKSVSAFLTTMWKNKLLAGTRAEEAFYVICDESNNPPSVINANRFRGRFGLKHKNTNEFVEYEVEEDLRDLDAEIGG